MPFRLRKDTKKWFQGIDFSLDFDMYYLSLMAGLATGRKESIPTADTTELVDNFPGSYNARRGIIVGLFLCRELRAMGISFTDKTTVHSQISKLVDPRSPSQLRDAGMQEINRYSYGGFDVLAERFEDRPRAMETFLPKYYEVINDMVLNNT